MPFRYEVDEARNRLSVTVSGPFTDADLVQLESEFLADPRLSAGFRALLDVTGATTVEVSERTIDVLVDLDARHSPKMAGSKMAVVVHDRAGWNVAKRFEARAKRSVMVFYNLDIARTWLGID